MSEHMAIKQKETKQGMNGLVYKANGIVVGQRG